MGVRGGRGLGLSPVLRATQQHQVVLAVCRLGAGPRLCRVLVLPAPSVGCRRRDLPSLTRSHTWKGPTCQGEGSQGASSLGWSRGHLVRQQEVPCPRVPRVHSQTRGREDDLAHPAWGLGLKGHSEVQAGCLAFSRLGS